jgi:hypothetical protein
MKGLDHHSGHATVAALLWQCDESMCGHRSNALTPVLRCATGDFSIAGRRRLRWTGVWCFPVGGRNDDQGRMKWMAKNRKSQCKLAILYLAIYFCLSNAPQDPVSEFSGVPA